ncbi:hypothetical protein GCM10010452_83250 [Crossiella cryophila]
MRAGTRGDQGDQVEVDPLRGVQRGLAVGAGAQFGEGAAGHAESGELRVLRRAGSPSWPVLSENNPHTQLDYLPR